MFSKPQVVSKLNNRAKENNLQPQLAGVAPTYCSASNEEREGRRERERERKGAQIIINSDEKIMSDIKLCSEMKNQPNIKEQTWQTESSMCLTTKQPEAWWKEECEIFQNLAITKRLHR